MSSVANVLAAYVGAETFGRCATRSWMRSVCAAAQAAACAGSGPSEAYGNSTWSHPLVSCARAISRVYPGSQTGPTSGVVSVDGLPYPAPRNSTRTSDRRQAVEALGSTRVLGPPQGGGHLGADQRDHLLREPAQHVLLLLVRQ